MKGGVYGVTRGLHARFGAGRVFDTLLDETSILGLALGAAVSGFVPLPEIQYLAYLHNAEDQLRGEAATLQFFSQGAVPQRHGRADRRVRLPEGLRRPLPQRRLGRRPARHPRPRDRVAVAAGRRRGDAANVRRGREGRRQRLRLPRADRAVPHPRPVRGGRRPLARRRPSAEHVPLGSARTYGSGRDLTILTWGNGLPMSLRVARRLEQRGIDARVVDLRWLAPLPIEDIAREAVATQRVLVVDETRRSRRRLRGRDRDADRRGLRRPAGARHEQGLVRPARRRGEPRPPLGGRDRGRRARARLTVRARPHGLF